MAKNKRTEALKIGKQIDKSGKTILTMTHMNVLSDKALYSWLAKHGYVWDEHKKVFEKMVDDPTAK